MHTARPPVMMKPQVCAYRCPLCLALCPMSMSLSPHCTAQEPPVGHYGHQIWTLRLIWVGLSLGHSEGGSTTNVLPRALICLLDRLDSNSRQHAAFPVHCTSLPNQG